MFTNALKSIVFSFDCYLLLVIIWTFKNMFQERKEYILILRLKHSPYRSLYV